MSPRTSNGWSSRDARSTPMILLIRISLWRACSSCRAGSCGLADEVQAFPHKATYAAQKVTDSAFACSLVRMLVWPDVRNAASAGQMERRRSTAGMELAVTANGVRRRQGLDFDTCA